MDKKGKSQKIRKDHDSEFIIHITNDRSQIHEIVFQYIQPEKSTQNSFIELFG